MPLSKVLLYTLRQYFKQYRPETYLFKGQPCHPYSSQSAQIVLRDANQKAGIHEKGSIHSLSHSYSAHMLEAGTDLCYIQAFLGHNRLKTAMLYTHISKLKLETIQSPLDRLKL